MKEKINNKSNEELFTLFMLIDKGYENGTIPNIEYVLEHYDIINEAGLTYFVGTLDECCDAMNKATELHRIKHKIIVNKSEECVMRVGYNSGADAQFASSVKSSINTNV